MDFHFDEKKHLYYSKGKVVSSVTNILLEEGFVDTTWFTDEGRERGSDVHKLIHVYDNDEWFDEDTISQGILNRLNAWIQFKSDTGFIVEASEVPLYSETYQFAGTPDKVGKLNGSPAILDLKSGVIDSVAGLQLSFYEILTNHPHKRFALQLTGEGKYKLIPFVGRQDRNLCLSILAINQWKKNNLKRKE